MQHYYSDYLKANYFKGQLDNSPWGGGGGGDFHIMVSRFCFVDVTPTEVRINSEKNENQLILKYLLSHFSPTLKGTTKAPAVDQNSFF